MFVGWLECGDESNDAVRAKLGKLENYKWLENYIFNSRVGRFSSCNQYRKPKDIFMK